MAPRPRRRPLSRLGRAQSCPDARRRAEGALRGNSETSFFFKKKGEREEKQKTKKEKKRGAGGKQHLCFLFFFLLFFPFAFPFFCFSFFSFHFSFCEPLFLNSASPFFKKIKNNKQDKEKQWPEGFLLHAKKSPLYLKRFFLHAGKF